jgi:glycosyltransferase involved in cell wall biosynthesis
VRLLLVVAALRPGGAERIVTQLATDATRRGDAVLVASSGGSWVDLVRACGADHVAVPLGQRSAPATVAAAPRLAAVVREFRPDVVHAHNVRAGLAAGLAVRLSPARSRRRPALLTTLHGLAPADYPAAARLLRLGGTVVACAPAIGAALLEAGFPAGRLKVITNGVRVRAPSAPELAAARRRYGIGRRPLVVGIGRLVAQKAWPTLIEAARHIDAADVLVAGDGPLRSKLEAAAGARTRFVGHVDQPAALVAMARCVVSTSAWEGLPLALLEALTLGAPVVATSVGGITDLVPPDAAMLVPPGDPVAVAAAVNRVLAEPALADRLSHAARAASAAWTLDGMLAAYRECYAACVSARA